ncbi:MAG: hypothetical protein methR_P2575 [Methyloprofundus sp.]|nr:MAG: hypothetical protein methR_P2575 [Methyloprofundus sp.]
MTSWLIKVPAILTLGLLLNCTAAVAIDCSTVQYLKNKSPGTQILSNGCIGMQTLSVGSELELAAGARLWLKSVYNATTNQQLICQNRSSIPVRINIENLANPWIKVANIENCQQWVNNRLNCSIADGQKFFCVSSIIKRPTYSSSKPERTTSVQMRAIAIGKPENIAKAETYIDIAVLNMQPEINLCRNLLNSQAPVELIWNVKLTGEVDDVSILSEGNYELSSCIRDIVMSYKYPKPKETLTFVYKF